MMEAIKQPSTYVIGIIAGLVGAATLTGIKKWSSRAKDEVAKSLAFFA